MIQNFGCLLLLLLGLSCSSKERLEISEVKAELEQDTIYDILIAPLVALHDVHQLEQRLVYNLSKLEFLCLDSLLQRKISLPKEEYKFLTKQFYYKKKSWESELREYEQRIEKLKGRLNSLAKDSSVRKAELNFLGKKKVLLDTLFSQAKAYKLDDPYVTKEEVESYLNY